MGYDPVPWMVGGGAEHSPEVGRLVAYAASGGVEGCVGSTDLKVTALGTPGLSVSVARGSLMVPNRFTSNTQESYVVRMATPETVAIAATGAGVTRTDLIATIITDPFVAGSTHPTPPNAKVGPYVKTIVVPNVSTSVKRLQDVAAYATATGFALARVTLPPSTTGVTNAMITDLRSMAQTATSRIMRAVTSTGSVEGANAGPIPLNSYGPFPTQATWPISIPTWATHAVVRGDINAFRVIEGWVQGRVRAMFVGQVVRESSFDLTTAVPDSYRSSVGFASEITIASQYRGTTQTLSFEGMRSSGTGRIVADLYTQSLLDITFEQRTE